MPWTIRKRNDEWCVYKQGQDGQPTGDLLGCHSTRDEAEGQIAALHVNVKEIVGVFQDVMVVSELRGTYPNVPIAADIDLDALVASEGGDPMFLTLPIAKINSKSANGRYYDEAFVLELMRQTIEKRPIGLMGHMSEEERKTAFKPEAVHWIGAVRDGDMIWGKGLVVGEAKARVARYKASGKPLATSIDAQAIGDWDESLRAYRMRADSLDLGQIDFAPADRAGIRDLARVPMITSEMDDTEIRENEMTREEFLASLTAEDVRLFPAEVRAAILAESQPIEVAQVGELRGILGVDAQANLTNIVNEMVQTRDAQRAAAVTSRVTELVTEGVKVIGARGIITELVMARKPKTPEEAEAFYKEVAASAPVTEMLKSQVSAIMGPSQSKIVQGQGGQSKYFVIPDGSKE
jgi:hypothetical protein